MPRNEFYLDSLLPRLGLLLCGASVLLGCNGPGNRLGPSTLNQVSVSAALTWPSGAPVSPQQIQSVNVQVFGAGKIQCDDSDGNYYGIVSGPISAGLRSTGVSIDGSARIHFSASFTDGFSSNDLDYCPTLDSPRFGGSELSIPSDWSLATVAAVSIQVYLRNSAENCAAYCVGNPDAGCAANCESFVQIACAQSDPNRAAACVSAYLQSGGFDLVGGASTGDPGSGLEIQADPSRGLITVTGGPLVVNAIQAQAQSSEFIVPN